MSLLTSTIVHGLTTTAPWVDRFVVELYSDAGYTNKIASGYSSATWDGVYNKQKEPITFGGLTIGQTYYVKGMVMSPVTGALSVVSTYTLVAGSATGPTGITYSIYHEYLAAAGIFVSILPAFATSDIDRFEVVWVGAGSTAPASDVIPMWHGSGGLYSGLPFAFFVGGSAGAAFDLYVRAVNTAQIAQSWVNVGTVTVGTLDHVADGVDYARVSVTALDQGMVDPRRSGFLKFGSLNPAWSVQGFHSDMTTTSSGVYWSGLGIKRIDGSTTSISDRAEASRITTSGLTAGATYFYYPYWDEFNAVVGFIKGTVGSAVGVGTDGGNGGAGMLYTATSDDLARAQSLQDQTPLSQGGMKVILPSSGTTTGGSYGGSGCPRKGMLVLSRTRGTVSVEACVPGEEILSRNGEWVTVLFIRLEESSEFIRLKLPNGNYIDQDPSTPMVLEDGEEKVTSELSLQDIICLTEDRISRLRSIEHIEEKDWKVVIGCSDPHLFACGALSPEIITHNVMSLK